MPEDQGDQVAGGEAGGETNPAEDGDENGEALHNVVEMSRECMTVVGGEDETERSALIQTGPSPSIRRQALNWPKCIIMWPPQ